MPKKLPPLIDQVIFTIRNCKVILDADLAAIYGVQTKALNQAVKRNSERFPTDFMFRLSAREWAQVKSEATASSSQNTANEPLTTNRSQFVTGSRRSRHSSSAPYAFTEHGAIMAATVLNSPAAVRMSQYVVRAFVKQRELLMAQADFLKRLAQIDAKLLQHDKVLQAIVQGLKPLLDPPAPPSPGEIGFHIREDSPAYRVTKKRKRPRA